MLYDEMGKAHGMGIFPKCKCPHTGAVTYTKTTCLGGRDKLTKLKRPTGCKLVKDFGGWVAQKWVVVFVTEEDMPTHHFIQGKSA